MLAHLNRKYKAGIPVIAYMIFAGRILPHNFCNIPEPYHIALGIAEYYLVFNLPDTFVCRFNVKRNTDPFAFYASARAKRLCEETRH